MIEIDGSQGGGQLLRTALTLSMVTATPFTMTGIRAKRSRPGLMRQHLTAVEAARQVSDAEVTGADAGSQTLTFVPNGIRSGDFHFPIGTAGSTTLVLQTVLPALSRASGASTLHLEGGTHNPLAPPADFLIDVFAPVLGKMGVQADIRLVRHGFYPAGGGVMHVQVQSAQALKPLHLVERGALRAVSAHALVSNLSASVADRELKVVARRLGLQERAMKVNEIKPALGPGNALVIKVESEHMTECFVTFGERGVSAEQVAERACDLAQAYIRADVAVGCYTADQLLLPMALAGSGSFTTTEPTDHARTNASLIEKFLEVQIDFRELRKAAWKVDIN